MQELRRVRSGIQSENVRISYILKGNSGVNTSWAEMKEHGKFKRMSHHWPSCADWFLRYPDSKSQHERCHFPDFKPHFR